ncbi:MAG: GGDEF domain-containing protein, partial [Spirochaetes bacterium]|nr:GGDEF domain-containing protein [Spirochaetota bacterium]
MNNKKIKKLFINFITSNMYYQYDMDTVRKVIFTNLLCTLGVFFLLIFGLHAFLAQYYTIAILDYISATILMIMFIYIRIKKSYIYPALICFTIFGLLFIFFVITGGYKNSGLLWTYIFPIFVFFVFGTKIGTIGITLFLSIVLTIIILGNLNYIPVQYQIDVVYRYIASFCSVSIGAFCFDYIRERMQNDLLSKNKKLRSIRKRLVQANHLLNQQVITDALTNIPNRRGFMDFYEKEWSRALRNHKELSLILVDIDFFKPYNDYYGHLKGDECLRKVATALYQCVDRPSDMVGRL